MSLDIDIDFYVWRCNNIVSCNFFPEGNKIKENDKICVVDSSLGI